MTPGKLIFIHKKQQSTSTRTAPQSSSFTTKTPARLNNIGVGLLLAGRNEDSLKVFTKALKITKAFLVQVAKNGSVASEVSPSLSPRRRAVSPLSKENNTQDGRPRSISFDSHFGNDHSVDSVPHSRPLLSRRTEHCMKRQRAEQGESGPSRPSLPTTSELFLFSEPSTTDEEECPYSEGRACLMKLSASIIFNMALANHKKGLSRKKRMGANSEEDISSSTKQAMVADLKKALALYELSCRMQSREKIELDAVVVLGHMNNMGHIHATLGNTLMAGRCIRQLLKKLVLYKKQARGSEQEQKACVGFHQNAASLLLRNNGRRSPAAA